LIIRFGYLRQYADMSGSKRAALDERYKTHKPDNIGVEPSRELLEFLWEKEVAAVAGDARSFEVWPCAELKWHLHEWLLAGWGMPIGELFDLEELARVCGELGRWSFFLTSAVMNVSVSLWFPCLLAAAAAAAATEAFCFRLFDADLTVGSWCCS
jgi:hypothetical protein